MISVVVPTHNNADKIVETIENIHAAMQEKYEIIIIDDSSADNTWERAMEAGAKRPIRVICWKTRRGKSYALWRGIKDAKGDVIAVIDDLRIASSAVKNMVDEVRKGCDIFGYIVREPQNLFERMASTLARVPYAWSPAFALARRSIDDMYLFKRFSHRLFEILVKNRQVRSKKTVILDGCTPKWHQWTLAYSFLLLIPWIVSMLWEEVHGGLQE